MDKSLSFPKKLLLLGALMYRSTFNGSAFALVLYLLISITSFGFSAYTWSRGSSAFSPT